MIGLGLSPELETVNRTEVLGVGLGFIDVKWNVIKFHTWIGYVMMRLAHGIPHTPCLVEWAEENQEGPHFLSGAMPPTLNLPWPGKMHLDGGQTSNNLWGNQGCCQMSRNKWRDPSMSDNPICEGECSPQPCRMMGTRNRDGQSQHNQGHPSIQGSYMDPLNHSLASCGEQSVWKTHRVHCHDGMEQWWSRRGCSRHGLQPQMIMKVWRSFLHYPPLLPLCSPPHVKAAQIAIPLWTAGAVMLHL